jgi:bacterioferritin
MCSGRSLLYDHTASDVNRPCRPVLFDEGSWSSLDKSHPGGHDGDVKSQSSPAAPHPAIRPNRGRHSARRESIMGTRGTEIVGAEVDKILDFLNKAFCDEWLAYYQYWLGAKLAKGPMKEAVMAELTQHAADELRHADMVSNRIIQLGGVPVTQPRAWYDLTNCTYEPPDDPYVTKLLEQNIAGEQCAINVYSAMIKETRESDPVTYNMALQILQDEVEHEEDLQSLQEDLQLMLDRRAK